MIIKGFTIWILLLRISIIGVLGAIQHDNRQINRNGESFSPMTQSENDSDKRFARSLSNEPNYGYINFYIRQSCNGGPQSKFTKKSFPYVRITRQEMSSYGSLIRVSRWTPIFVDRYSRQTFFRTQYDTYIVPSMINVYGKSISVGHLIANGYATVSNYGFPLKSHFDITSCVIPGSYPYSNNPIFNYRLGRFSDGVHTHYQSDFKRYCDTNDQERNEYDKGYKGGKYKHKPDYYQPPYKNKKTTTNKTPTSTTGTDTRRPEFLTKCQSELPNRRRKRAIIPHKKLKIPAYPKTTVDRVLLENTYMVEFAPSSFPQNHLRTVLQSLKTSENINASNITTRCNINSPLFSGISFTVNVNHSLESIEGIQDAIAVYPVYIVHRPEPIKYAINSQNLQNDGDESVNSYNLTNVNQVHGTFNNYGKGVKVAVIDDGVYYLHPALGGCFGEGCKVAFGYDFIGDSFTPQNPVILPDNDPIDTCSDVSHGTHVAGIIAANTSGITQEGFNSYVPFVGVAPQVTIGAYRVLGCGGSGPSDVIAEGIYRAYNDGVDIINLSLGGPGPYPDDIQSIAVQRVSAAGVYVVISAGNSGSGGLQTTGRPSNALEVMSIGSIDNQYLIRLDRFIIIAPNEKNIVYIPGTPSGGWKTVVNLTIVVNNPNRISNDGCTGPSKTVSGAVVLYYYVSGDSCSAATRCNLAAAQGAVGCLLYNTNTAAGVTNIPSGSISLADGLEIIAQIEANQSAIYTFTNLGAIGSLSTPGAPSSFSSFGFTGDLFLKPQLSGIGGSVYSTVSPRAALADNVMRAYNNYGGTSMAAPYVSGTLALFLASIGNPSPSTVNSTANDGICRPPFRTAMNIFQSTAQPVKIYNTDLLATAAQQGAGLVNAYRALTSTIIISPSELSLNDTVRKESSYKVNVTNIGNTNAKYKLSHQGAALATGKASNDDQLLTTPIYSADYATVTFVPSEFELGSGETREVTLRFSAPSGANSNLLPIYSGFVYVTNEMSGEAVHLTYAGVVGDYGNARIIVRSSPGAPRTGIMSQNTNSLITADGETLNALGPINLRTALAWSSREFGVEVIEASDNDSLPVGSGLGILISDGGYLVYRENAPRNTAIETQTFSAFNSINWAGSVYNLVMSDVIVLPPGQYRIRFFALKHFRDGSNRGDDFETYTSPMFNLVY